MIYIRSSMLSSYTDCQRRAAAQHWKQEITEMGYTLKTLPNTIGGAVGDGVHAGAKFLLDRKRETGQIGSVNDSIDLGMATLSEKSALGVRFDTNTVSMNEAEKQCASLIFIYANTVTPGINPFALEVYRKATVLPEVEFGGSCDIETVEEAIEDNKFGSKCRPCQAQLGGYSILKKSDTGISATELKQNHIPRTSTGKPSPVVEIIKYDVGMCERMAYAMIMHIARDMKAFLKTQNPWAFPANPMSMMCSEKYCPGFKTNWCEILK
jgi:hypothetical protein